jgi:ketosteroid isomerase-like protein
MTHSTRFALGVASIAMVSTLMACAKPAPAVDLAKEAAAINAADAAINAAMKAKDAVKATAYDADDIVNYAPGYPPVLGKAADLAGDKAGFTDPAFTFSFTVDHTEVAKSGDLAYQSGAFSQTDTNPTTRKVESSTGNWVAAWRKGTDGTWLLAAVAATPTTAAAPAAAPAKPS